MSQAVEVKILGQPYKLRSDGGGEYILELAGFVEEILGRIQSQTASFTTRERVAVMAALHIADEFLQLKRRNALQEHDANQKVGALIRASDDLLTGVES